MEENKRCPESEVPDKRRRRDDFENHDVSTWKCQNLLYVLPHLTTSQVKTIAHPERLEGVGGVVWLNVGS
jgi:hypothetical protein